MPQRPLHLCWAHMLQYDGLINRSTRAFLDNPFIQAGGECEADIFVLSVPSSKNPEKLCKVPPLSVVVRSAHVVRFPFYLCKVFFI
uniref:Uncharacterized protein n=1 Tax=Pyxicephalus adspersus TaxID=30357 RepID=A0AAV2ZSS0_PYXAD|nr:TPA: hypothetical protein GDO54_005638 [Pyxicephalus adspersus]